MHRIACSSPFKTLPTQDTNNYCTLMFQAGNDIWKLVRFNNYHHLPSFCQMFIIWHGPCLLGYRPIYLAHKTRLYASHTSGPVVLWEQYGLARRQLLINKPPSQFFLCMKCRFDGWNDETSCAIPSKWFVELLGTKEHRSFVLIYYSLVPCLFWAAGDNSWRGWCQYYARNQQIQKTSHAFFVMIVS